MTGALADPSPGSDPALHYRCAAAARTRNDPLPGSAAPATRWLLIEHPGPWSEAAMLSPPFDSVPGRALSAAATAAGVRVLLIRRPGRLAPDAEKAWALVDHEQGIRWGHWEDVEDLEPVRRALAEELVPDGDQSPLFLVCVHARHDVCCAVRGRPVASALSARWPHRTWQCSHLGGDRFAANVLVVPDGTTYGQVEADDAVRVMDAHLRGEVDAAFLRGASTLPPVSQAAVIEAMRRHGPVGPLDITPTRVTATGTNEWRVDLVGPVPLRAAMSVTVTRRRRPAALLTCRAEAASAADEYAVQWVAEASPPSALDRSEANGE